MNKRKKNNLENTSSKVAKKNILTKKSLRKILGGSGDILLQAIVASQSDLT